MPETDAQYCDYCGKQILSGSKFCDFCGQSLGEQNDHQALPSPSARQEAQSRSTRFMRQRIAWAVIFGLILIPIVLLIIWKDVGELSRDVWLSLGGFIVVTSLLAVFTLRKGGSTWQGQLVQVIPREKGVQFVFLTNKGKKESLIAGSSLVKYFSVGDQVIKVKGYDFPEKIHRDGKTQLCMVCGKVYPMSEKRCRFCRYPSMDPHNFM
ncbi:zinc-ribbon domain-containing protein [Candidatus Brevifilum fermentans]|jgi:predicted nucleic acid-binding Zn ribbon protein|uniref:Zinc-ribbon domain-containing protein n=1 Tax=Candidatus Brevifilum fermentans TaxID=1986204 RepID=A0A1Y6K306_9CHLR|nr:zinc-ribbon domain-containing protein [Brevefilum fermentans]SMX53946.1 protein of unknown function [Brevefilum fermentans]